jgi:hypothetical protein
MIRTLFLLCVLTTQSFENIFAQQRDSTNIDRAQLHQGRGIQAFRNRDFEKYFAELKMAHGELPYHAALLYYLTQSALLSNHRDDAKRYMDELIGIGFYIDLSKDTIVTRRLPEVELSATIRRMEANRKVIANGKRAITIPELDLAAEGIAFDKTSGSFFVSSIHKQKIIKIDKSGEISDFSIEADSLLGVFGMYSDGKKLWACNVAVPQCSRFEKMKDKRSFISVHDLATGKVLNKIYVSSPVSQLKDVTMTPDGVLYFTDMRNNMVYEYKSGAVPEAITTSGVLGYALGITSSSDGKYLFIADHLQGVLRLERSTKKLMLLKSPAGTIIQGIDGVYFSGGNLIGVQNNRGFSRVVVCTLNRSLDTVTSLKVMDSWHPDHDWPTLGVVVGKHFYYVANSQWNNFNNKGGVVDSAKSTPTYVLNIGGR